MLQKEAQRVGLSIPPEFYVYDTLPVYRREFPLKDSKKLGDLYAEFFGREMENAHDALADSIGLQELFCEELYAEKFDTSDIFSLSTYNVFQNDQPVQDICGIGPATAWKIGKYTHTAEPLLRDLRKLMSGKTDEEIDCFIREEFNQHQESYVFSIWYAITNGHGRPPSFFFQEFSQKTRFPFCDKAFRSYWNDAGAATLESANIRSVEMLRRYYYYVLQENDEELKKFANVISTDFHAVKLLVTI